jgi:hypothetical protein
MHALQVIKTVSADAMDDDDPDAEGLFRSIVGPNPVLEMAEIALNHKLKGMEGIYDVREEIPERRVALERWAAFIIACEQGLPVPTNVVPLRVEAA